MLFLASGNFQYLLCKTKIIIMLVSFQAIKFQTTTFELIVFKSLNYLSGQQCGMPRLYWQHRYVSKALGICFDKDLTGFENLLGLDTSRARRAIISMFAVSVVGGYYYIMAPCHPDGREGSQ